jgi:hypothetical protein
MYLNNAFSKELNFESYDEMNKYSFMVHNIPVDGTCYATKLPTEEWAIWEDEGYPPYPTQRFPNWKEAIHYARKKFEQRALPEECWCPIGFDEEGEEFEHEPDINKVPK